MASMVLVSGNTVPDSFLYRHFLYQVFGFLRPLPVDALNVDVHTQ